MKTVYSLFFASFCAIGGILDAQLSVNTAIRPSKSSTPTEECYELLVQASEQDVPLSTQSYRLYYDASGLRFLRQRTSTVLDAQSYTPPNVLQAIHNANATGFGTLDFDKNIGFINLVINHLEGKQPTTIPSGQWQNTARICFEPIGEQKQIVWARSPVTNGYATAFTSIGAWIGQKTESLIILEYGDLRNGIAPDNKISESTIRY